MLLRLKYLFLFIGFIGIPNILFAQFKGGSSNGGDSKTLIQSSCPTPENKNIYFGGNTNGAGIVDLLQNLCPVPQNGNIYIGGDANGASIQKLIQNICSAPENLSIFFGGIGGKAIQSLTNCISPGYSNIYFGGDANGASVKYLTSCPIPDPVNAFFGGNSDGYSNIKLSQNICPASENTNLFFGGITDGYAIKELTQNLCPPPEALNVFFGGSNDGYAAGNLEQSICPPAENTSIFLGGNADGYANQQLTQISCTSTENTNIFFGGEADGSAILSLMQSICGVPENTFIFQGGVADGQAIGSFEQTSCPVPENSNIFIGGYNDGYAVESLLQLVCPAPENTDIFVGGVADGFNSEALTQNVCPVPENTNIFSGGAGNGESFHNLVICTPPEIANIYFGGNANGASVMIITNCPVAIFTVEIYRGGAANGASSELLMQSFCTTPENLNIYLGGNGNGASNPKIIQAVCTPPENLNIYLGGIDNGASNSRITQTVCTPSENLNIYLGGNANGASSNTTIQTLCAVPQNWNIFFGGIADGYATRSLIQPYYWTGAVDHNWHDPANWSTFMVPDINTLAIIPNVVNYPVISFSTASSKSIILQAASRLDVNNRNLTVDFHIINDGAINVSGNPVIAIGGNFTCNLGSFSSGNSKVLFNSISGTQSIAINSGDFYDVEINTTSLASCQLASSITVRRNLTITAGSLNASADNITLTGNWNNSGAFIPGTGSVILNGTNQTISKASGENFYNLDIENNTHITLIGNITVSNNLTFTSGTITTGVYLVTVGTGVATPGIITYTSGRIIGRLERWMASNGTYLFPIGTSGNIETLNLTVNSGLTPGSLIVYYVTGDPGNSGLPLAESGLEVINQFTEGYWNLTASNGLVVNNYNVSLEANGFTSYAIADNTRIIKRTAGGGWLFDGTHSNASSPLCYRNNLTGGISTLGTQFGLGRTFDCTGGQISDNFNICVNGDVPAFVNITPPSGGDNNFIFTWQFTTNSLAIPGDSNWNDVGSSNTSAYDYGILTVETRFVRKATTTGCALPVYSNVLTITVYPVPVTGPIYNTPNQ
jgi:hypothetical protein